MTFNVINDSATTDNARNRAYDLKGRINQAMPRGFRLIGYIDYYTSVLTQDAYQQSLVAAQWRTFDFSIGGNLGRYRLDANMQRVDRFQDVDTINRSGRLPSVRLSMPERPIGRSRVYFGAAGEMVNFERHFDIDNPANNLGLWRFDALPTIRAPLSNWPFLSVATSASWRLTHWLERRDPTLPTRPQIPEGLTRQVLDLRADLTGPTFSKVYTAAPTNGYAERFKHLIEPRLSVQWVSAFDRIERGRQLRGRQRRLDRRRHDHVSYSLTNRVLARRKRAGRCIGGPRRSWRSVLARRYYTNAAAAAADPNNINLTTSPFTPLTLSVVTTPGDNVRADFRMELDPQFKKPREYRASATVTRGRTQVNGGWSKREVIPGRAVLRRGGGVALHERRRRR